MGFSLVEKSGKGKVLTKAWGIAGGIVERRHDEPVHYSIIGVACIACRTDLIPHRSVWTDDDELYDRHPVRCNFAFVATEEDS